MNKYLQLICIGTMALLTTSGIIRHDRNRKEFEKLAKDSRFDCVGHVFTHQKSKGSGVLIHESFVLTAASLVIDQDTKLDSVFSSRGDLIGMMRIPTNEYVTGAENVTITFNQKSYRVKRIIVHQTYLDSTSKGTCNLALLELTEPIKNVRLPELNSSFNELGNMAYGVGFGASGPANVPTEVALRGRKIAGQNWVDSAGGYVQEGVHGLLLADFDHPNNTFFNKMGSANPTDFEYVCAEGDFGGGLFLIHNNTLSLIGIAHDITINEHELMVGGYYGSIAYWTRVSAFYAWIRHQIHT